MDNAHKKYKALKTTLFVKIHGSGSSLEFVLGLFAVLFPENKGFAYAWLFIRPREEGSWSRRQARTADGRTGQTLEGSFSAVSKPIFAREY